MKILVTNDDGIYAPGLWAAVEALEGVGEVTVVAPDREQSGVGPSVTLNAPVRATEVVPAVQGIRTFAVEGTPADSVILALEELVGKVDIVVAGINSGANLGDDVLISGTVGAALQGYYRGIPSLAVSVTSLHANNFEAAARLLRALVAEIREGALSERVLLNVNVPPVAPEEVKGVNVTRLASRSYADGVKQGDDGKNKYYWITRNRPDWQVEEGTDVWAVRQRYVSITPLHTDMTNPRGLPALAGLPQRLAQTFPAKPASPTSRVASIETVTEGASLPQMAVLPKPPADLSRWPGSRVVPVPG